MFKRKSGKRTPPKERSADDVRFDRRQQAYRAVSAGRNVAKNQARIDRLAPPPAEAK